MSNGTPSRWRTSREATTWKYGPTRLRVSERPDMAQMPETGNPREDADLRIAKLIAALIILGALALVVREALP